MTRLFNVDIDNLITDYELSYQNSNDNFIAEVERLSNDTLKVYTQKVEEHSRVLKQITEVNNKINESREKLQCIANKIECGQLTMQTENDRLISVNNDCKVLEEEENSLTNLINTTKIQLSQVYKEKKENIKKIKKEINSFKTGVNMYEEFLQLDMNIENKENSLINITMRNLNNQTIYNVILEENDNDFKLIDILPHSQSLIKAAELYNQKKDIQGLLAFLYKSKE